MDQATGTARDTAAFARRLVLRAVTVLGGAVAGTAIAWCLSTAGASADTGRQAEPEIPVVAAVASPVTGTLDAVTGLLSDSARVGVAEELGQLVGGVAATVGGQRSECAGLPCELDRTGRGEEPDAADGLDRFDGRPAAAPPAGDVADPAAAPEDTAERSATGRASTDGTSGRGSPAPGEPAFPDVPAWPAPPAPAAPAPTSAHAGSAGGTGGSSLLGPLAWRVRVPVSVSGLTMPATDAPTFRPVGAQPGVTPD